MDRPERSTNLRIQGKLVFKAKSDYTGIEFETLVETIDAIICSSPFYGEPATPYASDNT